MQQQIRADRSTPKILVNPTEEHDLMSQPVELLSLAAMAHYSRTRCIKEMARSRTSDNDGNTEGKFDSGLLLLFPTLIY